METPSFKEDHISQIPALELLQKLGYAYISPEDAFLQRKKTSNVILEDTLRDHLPNLNQITYLGKTYQFEEHTFDRAVDLIKAFPLVEGPIRTNEKVYDLLTLGTSFEQNIEGDRKSFNLRYIDWESPENNVYHVSEEYDVQRTGSDYTYRPDIVLFVNGIPFVVIECKRPDLKIGKDAAIEEAIEQHLRNQKEDGINDLYKYSQILLSFSTNNAKFATTGSRKEYWSHWRELNSFEDQIQMIKNRHLTNEQKDSLFQNRFRYVRSYFEQLESQPQGITEQDRLIYSICRPERLLELAYRFIVYDAGEKKIARYQQYFAVKKTISRVKTLQQGKRPGGVIWHTQGSGKSLTMVMLAKAIALEKGIVDPKIVLVTDRIDLDDQIYRTFKNCGKQDELVQVKSGRHLVKIIRSKRSNIITTIINKFETALEISDITDLSPNIFVLVDESHRSQYGEANIKMQKVFPNACYIGFTGTPLMKKEKSTAAKFGGIIDTYAIDLAVKDKAVVPLLYEGREAVQEVKSKAIDNYFEKISEPLTEYQRADLKHKFSRADQLNVADQKIYAIVMNVLDHFTKTWQGTGFKGQLTAPSKVAAIRYKRFFDEMGLIKTEVLISPPDTREGSEDIYEETDNEVLVFWKNMMKRFGSYERYNKDLINLFKHEDHPEIIIVVDKLLTGFDSPRNVVLYITRSLKEHNLLQAIARVNRLHEGKDFGFIIDYYGILEDLDKALTTYSCLENFEEDDLVGTLTSVREEIDKLSGRHTHVWEIFREIENRYDLEAYERLLENSDLRNEFYDRLSLYSRTLRIATSSEYFYNKFQEDRIRHFKDDAKFFLRLRTSVKNRYSDAIDYSQYEKQVQKLIDMYVSTDEVIRITRQVNIFEKEEFEQELEKITGDARRADTIASRTAKYISEKYSEDPFFYAKFSKLLQETIEEMHRMREREAEQFGKLKEKEYLDKIISIKEAVLSRKDDSVPESIQDNDSARAFFGKTKEILEEKLSKNDNDKLYAEIGLAIDRIIQENLIVDWKLKINVQNKMRQAIDDYLYDLLDERNLNLDFDITDQIIENCLEIAKHRYK